LSPVPTQAPRRRALALLLVVLLAGAVASGLAQDIPPEVLEEAARQSGLSQEEILRRYQQQREQGAAVDTTAAPGRTSFEGIDDRGPRSAPAPAGRGESSYWVERPEVSLPMAATALEAAWIDSLLEVGETAPDTARFFGQDFFRLDAALFTPPSFGPVPADYLLGVGDELVIDMWGEVELRITRVVDRDGSIILPRGGKVLAHNRSLAQVTEVVRERLARSYSGLEDGSIELDVSLGKLRSIRVFVIGDVVRPGGYEVSSVSTVMTALHAAGGPSGNGSFRRVHLIREGEIAAELDLYRYLTGGVREQDRVLREGDTVLVPPRGRTVQLSGEVRRERLYELTADETLVDLVRYGGGFTPVAETRVVHVERIIPPAERGPDRPDRTWIDIYLDPATGAIEEPGTGALLDGDRVVVDRIADVVWGWVEIQGHVKNPGRYEFNEGLTVRELVEQAGGPWPDVLLELAVIDRTDELERFTSVTVPLGEVLSGAAPDLRLRERDVLRVFARGQMIDRETVVISGEVRAPGRFDFRRGMTLLDLIVRAGGIKNTGDLEHVEIQRLEEEKVFSAAAEPPGGETVETIVVNMAPDYLARGGEILLEAYDQVVVRRLPWYQQQRIVQVRGEVLYNGAFALETQGERLSSVIRRAGGLKPTAYARGARVERSGLGNVAIDLEAALADPGGPQDIIMQQGDLILVPEHLYTVKVVGEVGFPTALVYEKGKKIDWYVDRAGGYLEKADKGKSRVIHPNGLSQPNKGGHQVLPGSTIVVPVEPPPEGPSTLETVRDFTTILLGLATVWLAIDRATD
jgi:protein involved in polysaccharide export with SLBB domain